MAHPFDFPGGLFLWATQYIRPTRDIFNSMGSAANQALFNVVMTRLLAHDGSSASGIFDGGDFLVTDAGGGVLQVAPGFGLVHDDTADDPFGLAYRPIVSADPMVLVVDEADPANDRIDVVSVAPAEVDDTPDTIWVRSSGNLSPQEIPTRRRFAAQAVITKGEPGEGAPAVPSGHVKLAEVRVLAADAGVEVGDCRPILSLAHEIRRVPGGDHVVEGLVPSASGFVAVSVSGGIADFGRRLVRYAPTTLFPTEHPGGVPRYDLIVARDDGTLELIEGTTTQPTQADAPEGSLLLGFASVIVGPSVQSVFDRRELGSIGPAQLQRGTVVGALADFELPGAKLANNGVTTAKLAGAARPICVQLTHQGYSGTNQRHTILAQVVDANGAPISRTVDLSCVMRDATWNPGGANATQFVISAGAPWDISGAGSQRLIRTNGSGQVTILATHPSPPNALGVTVYLEIQPLGTPGGGGYLAFPVDAAP